MLGYAARGGPVSVDTRANEVAALWPRANGKTEVAVWTVAPKSGICGSPGNDGFSERGRPNISLTCGFVQGSTRPPAVRARIINGTSRWAAIALTADSLFVALSKKATVSVAQYELAPLRLEQRWTIPADTVGRTYLRLIDGATMLAVTARSQAGQRVAELFRLRQGRWQLAFSAPAGPRGVLDFDGGPRRGVIAFQSKAGDLEVLSLDEQAEPGDRHIVDVRPTTAVARLLGTDIDLAYAGERGSRKVFGLDTFRGRSSELHESPNGLDATPIGIVANDGTIRVLVDSSGAGQRRFTAGAQAQPRSSEPTLASTAVYRARQWFRTETRVGFHAIVAGADKNGPVTFIGTTLLLSPPSPRVAYELGTVTG